MTEEQFVKELLWTLDFPFEHEEVTAIVTNLDGGCFIDLKDGSTYYITIGKCEEPD